MSNYIQYTTEDGAIILVEAAVEPDEDQSGVVRAGLREKAGETVVQAKANFEEGLEIVRHSADAFMKKLRDLSDPPNEVEMTFGLKATGEMGNFAVAKAGAEANYTVKLTWKREDRDKQAEG
jgi:hypothetical protein